MMVNDWDLCRFGGIYLDMDMLVSRPLNSLHNTVGSEITVTGESRLNGAVLIFEKSRLGLAPFPRSFKLVIFFLFV